jgi:hypothetical protein
LLFTDSERNTDWYWAAGEDELEALQNVWDWSTDILRIEEIRNNLLLSTDIYGNTSWRCVADKRELDALQKFWEWATHILTT